MVTDKKFVNKNPESVDNELQAQGFTTYNLFMPNYHNSHAE